MILDSLLCFTGTSKGATGGIASGPNTDAPTTGTQAASNIIDLGVGQAVPPYTVTQSALPPFSAGGGARDLGIGDDPALKLMIQVTTPMAGGTSLSAQLQGAPDNGSGAPGAYVTMWTGPAVALAALGQGAYIANVDVPRTIAGQPPPRFLQLNFVSAGTFTGGAVEACIVLDRFDLPVGATNALSGYVPGITIPN